MGRVEDKYSSVDPDHEERPLTAEAQAVGVGSVDDLWCPNSVQTITRITCGKRYGYYHRTSTLNPTVKSEEPWLVTDRLDLDADLVALAYRYRWAVEPLRYRWFKCILGCRHLLFEDATGEEG